MGSMSPTSSDRVKYAVMSDVGRRRANNQDSYIVAIAHDETAWQSRGDLFVVADGMGAHAAGELASRLAVEGVSHVYLHRREAGPVDALREAIIATNAEIHQRGRANVEFHNMGTTCSALVLGPAGAVIGHVGDSRVYRLRGSQLDQLTFDHSLVWEMRAMGQAIGQTNAGFGLPKNVITRSLGPNADVQVDVEGPLATEVGDRFLICSDGLSGKIEDREIALMIRYLGLEEAVAWLTDLANLRGGPDNITVVLIEASRNTLTDRVPMEPGAIAPTTRLAFLSGAIGCGLLGMILFATGVGRSVAMALALLAGALAVVSRLYRPPAQAPSPKAKLGKTPYSTSLLADDPEEFDTIDDSLTRAIEDVSDVEAAETVASLRAQLETAHGFLRQRDFRQACRAYSELTQALLRLVRSSDSYQNGDLFG